MQYGTFIISKQLCWLISYQPLFINTIDCLVIVYMLQMGHLGIMEVVVVVGGVVVVNTRLT